MKTKPCSELLQLMNSQEDPDYGQSLDFILSKYPDLDRAVLENELDVYI